MKMKFSFSAQRPGTDEVGSILNSYRSPFWIEEHRWYVQCHWFSTRRCFIGYLYTLPYHFKDFVLESLFNVQSTLPDGTIDRSFDHVQLLSVQSPDSGFQFPYLHRLSLLYPASVLAEQPAHHFDSLRCLTVRLSPNVIDGGRMQDILHRMVQLRSLAILNVDRSSDWLFALTHPSIHRLSFDAAFGFDGEQCQKLIRSSLVQQCRCLSIGVSDPMSIVDLVEHLPHLRTLNAHQWKTNKRDSSSQQDELLHWLNDQSAIQFSVDSESKESRSSFILWIR